jgi:hypothetical protein
MASTSRGVNISRRVGLAAALAVYLVGGSWSSVLAQKKIDYALIYGTVWGPDDRAIGGIPVKIQRVGDKKPKWELVSDQRGEFAQRVPPGQNDYIVIADIKVPKGTEKPQTKAHIDNNERVDISLHLPQ